MIDFIQGSGQSLAGTKRGGWSASPMLHSAMGAGGTCALCLLLAWGCLDALWMSIGMLSCPNVCSQLGLAHARQKTACRSCLRTDLLRGVAEEVTRTTMSGSPWS